MTKITVAKFGGSLISDANDFRDVVEVIKTSEPQLVIISATRGTTNLLEQIWLFNYQGKLEEKNILIQDFKSRHEKLANDLGVWKLIQEEFESLVKDLIYGPSDKLRYPSFDFSSRNLDLLDHILSIGEKTSSLILCHCLDQYDYLYAPDYIKTDSSYSAANVDFQKTKECIKSLSEDLVKGRKFVSQGFIGMDQEGKVTTLGREGSDYSATIFAGLLNSDKVTIYTDVPGVFQADPKKWTFCKVIENLSYSQAELMAQKGAKVLFPKTLMPLKEKRIVLEVTNLNRESVTIVSEDASMQPAFVFKGHEMYLFCSVDTLIIQGLIKEIFGDLCSQYFLEKYNWHRLSFAEKPSTKLVKKFFKMISQ